MRAVIQRVLRASVAVSGEVVGQIGPGLLILLGVGQGDTVEDADYLAEKVANLRIFPDDRGKLNLSVLQTGGAILAVSQFTLFGDARNGRRPSFSGAARPDEAERFYHYFVERLRVRGAPVEIGRFQTTMEVESVNHGPVTMLLDSRKGF